MKLRRLLMEDNFENEENISNLLGFKEKLEEKPIESKESPKEIITSSLVEFFLFRLKKLYADMEFQSLLKEELKVRLAEAEFLDIKGLLHQEEENTNKAIQNLFLPFFNKLQEIKSPQDISIENQIANNVSSDILQSMNELTMFLSSLKEEKNKNENIKKLLESSLEENPEQNQSG